MTLKQLVPLAVLGMTLACATPAIAEDGAKPASGSHSAAATVNRDRARVANEEAAKKAIEAMLDANRLDLDIKLIGPTSEKIARDR